MCVCVCVCVCLCVWRRECGCGRRGVSLNVRCEFSLCKEKKYEVESLMNR